MFGEMLDTPPEERRRYFDLLRTQTYAQRASIMSAATGLMRSMVVAGLRRQFPAASNREIEVRLTVRLYGRDAARRIHGAIPDDAE